MSLNYFIILRKKETPTHAEFSKTVVVASKNMEHIIM